MVSISQYISILFLPAVYVLSYTVVSVVISKLSACTQYSNICACTYKRTKIFLPPCLKPLGLQYRIGVRIPAVYMYTCTINKGYLSAVDIVYGWKVEVMFFLGSNTINPILSI